MSEEKKQDDTAEETKENPNDAEDPNNEKSTSLPDEQPDCVELAEKIINPEIVSGMTYDQVIEQIFGYNWIGLEVEHYWDYDKGQQILNVNGRDAWITFYENIQILQQQFSQSLSTSAPAQHAQNDKQIQMDVIIHNEKPNISVGVGMGFVHGNTVRVNAPLNSKEFDPQLQDANYQNKNRSKQTKRSVQMSEAEFEISPMTKNEDNKKIKLK
eukprot:375349_1